jgi:hypothetical protein
MPLIKFATSCPTCGRKLFAPTELLGKQICCSHCQSCFYPSDVFCNTPCPYLSCRWNEHANRDKNLSEATITDRADALLMQIGF